MQASKVGELRVVVTRVLTGAVLAAGLAAVVGLGGCSPLMLGNTTREGKTPPVIAINKQGEIYKASKANVVSKNSDLEVTLSLANGQTCVGNLRLTNTLKSIWLLGSVASYIPGFSSEATLIYQGKWASDLPPDCLDLLQAPGGSPVESQIGEYHSPMIGPSGRAMSLITKINLTDADISAKSAYTYYIPTVKGVDD